MLDVDRRTRPRRSAHRLVGRGRFRIADAKSDGGGESGGESGGGEFGEATQTPARAQPAVVTHPTGPTASPGRLAPLVPHAQAARWRAKRATHPRSTSPRLTAVSPCAQSAQVMRSLGRRAFAGRATSRLERGSRRRRRRRRGCAFERAEVHARAEQRTPQGLRRESGGPQRRRAAWIPEPDGSRWARLGNECREEWARRLLVRLRRMDAGSPAPPGLPPRQGT